MELNGMIGGRPGGMVDCAQAIPPSPQSVINNNLDKLETSIARMEGLLGELFQKLSPIRNQMGLPAANESGKPECPKSPMSSRINDSASKISVYNLAIQTIIKEIEL